MAIITTTAKDAIQTSQRESRIVHITGSKEVHKDLRAECADNVAGNGNIVDYWGPDTDGESEWRVIVHDARTPEERSDDAELASDERLRRAGY